MRISGSWEPSVFKDRKELKWGMAPLPYLKRKVSSYESNMLVIPKGCRHPKEAFELAKFLAQEDYQNVIAETGRAIPASIAVTQSDLFKNAFDVDRMMMVRVAQTGILRGWKGRLSRYQFEIHDIEKRNLELVFLGEIQLEEAVRRIQERVDSLFLKEPWNSHFAHGLNFLCLCDLVRDI